MGIAIRSAEKMGLQRDGQLLGLSPLETEDRRRLWWQLQYLDLLLGVRSGSTSLSLMAPWDTKLPLNIEDEDINKETKTPPPERKGLTSLAYNLCTAWIISEQRGFFGGKLGVSWPFLKAVPHATKHVMIDKLEDGLNSQFLQYCDLVRPLDTLIQISMRSFIAGMRMVTLLPMAFSGDPSLADKDEHHRQLLEAAARTLEYTIAMNSRPELQHFRWWQESYFPWHGCKHTPNPHLHIPWKCKTLTQPSHLYPRRSPPTKRSFEVPETMDFALKPLHLLQIPPAPIR